MLPFFGLTLQYRVNLFESLHEMTFHGGKYDWYLLYNMPIWLRKFTHHKIVQSLESKESDSSTNTQIDLNNPNKSILPPVPQEFRNKAPKK